MSRDEFTKATKLAAWQASRGRCQVCTARLYPGKFEYHQAQHHLSNSGRKNSQLHAMTAHQSEDSK